MPLSFEVPHLSPHSLSFVAGFALCAPPVASCCSCQPLLALLPLVCTRCRPWLRNQLAGRGARCRRPHPACCLPILSGLYTSFCTSSPVLLSSMVLYSDAHRLRASPDSAYSCYLAILL